MTTTKKYKLTTTTKVVYGVTLFQIKALISFGNVSAGDFGGYIEKEDNLSQEGNAWVYGDAWVSGNARVSGNAQVFGDARVSGNAQVYGDAWVYGNARVFGNAQVYAKASFTQGWFIGGDDTGKITDITAQTGSNYWKNQYVLGDYKIEPIEEEVKTKKFVEVEGKKYELIEVTE